MSDTLTPVAQQICEKRYFQKDKDGNTVENWSELVTRVIGHVCGKEDEQFRQRVYNLVHKTEFLPNSPCLVNAGSSSKSKGLLACFVTKSPEDSWIGMLENIGNYGHIARQGGGCGVDFSQIRPEGDPVFGSTHAKACGPIEHMRMVSEVMSSITQSGFRGMACAPYDTMVSTELGFVPIGEIVEQNMTGIVIHTQFGPSIITGAWHNGQKEVFEIVTEKGNKVKLTGDHKVYVVDSYNGKNHGRLSKKINDVGIWKTVSELNLDTDCLVLNLDEKPFGLEYKQINDITIDEELASLIAYTKCDGLFARYNDCQRLELALDSQESINHFMNSSIVSFNRQQVRDNGITIVRKEGKSVEFMKHFGEFGTYHCDIPTVIFKSPKSVVAAFIKAAFDAEGTVDVSENRCRIITGMTSLEFVEGLQILLGMFGIQSQLRRDIVHVNKDGVLRQNMHYLSISNKWHVKKFMKEIGFLSRRKNDAAKRALKNMQFSGGRGNVPSSKIIHHIASIQSLGEMDVYDISTANETFLANNLTVHNCMGCLRVDHPDILNFIVCKQRDRALKTLLKEDIFNHYDQLKDTEIQEHLAIVLDKFISNFNVSVFATDDFMQKVENNEDYDLVFAGKVYATVNARTVFDMIVQNAWSNGDPGMLFYDSINNAPYQCSEQEITATNPCVTGDSLVPCEFGWREVKTLKEGDHIFSQGRLIPITSVEINENHKVFRVEFTDGDYIDVTAAHRFKCVVDKQYQYLRLDEIGEGYRVIVEPVDINQMEYKGIGILSSAKVSEDGRFKDIKPDDKFWRDRDVGLLVGAILGDGCFTERETNRKMVDVSFGKSEDEWKSRYCELLDKYGVSYYNETTEQTVRVRSNYLLEILQHAGMKRSKAPKKKIPDKFMNSNCAELLAGVLDGLFSTDGNMSLKKDNPMLRLTSSSYEMCRQVRRILLSFGIHAKIYRTERTPHIYDDPKYGEREISSENPKYDVVIMNIGIKKFADKIGLSHPPKNEKLQNCAKNYHYIGDAGVSKIKSITPLPGLHTVYDLFAEETDEWNVNGYVQQGCGEQCLPQYGSCNLGSIDVSKFFNDNRGTVEWTRLGEAIEDAVQFLDDVIDVNSFPTKDFAKWAQDNRPVGLGIMGWADLLLKMEIAYGSEESFKFAQRMGRFFQKTAHEKSVDLGRDRGTPKSCDYEELEHRRNVTTLSIAPTGTISLLAGCSSAIEPVFSAITYRYDNTGTKEIRHPYAKKSWFRSASDLDWEKHIGMQAAFQPYIDSAISKTINFPNSATVEDVSNAYLMAWKSKCKGITVYRDGSKTTQVLNTSKKDVVGANHAKPRPKDVDADIYRTRADGFDWHVIVGKVDDVPYEVFAVNGRRDLPTTGKLIKRKRRHYSLVNDEGECLIDNIGAEEDEIHPKIGLETRRFSLELRHNIDPKFIVEQIDKSNDVITSFSKAVGRIMKTKYISADALADVIDVPCMDCARKGESVQMIPEAGCWRCPNCHASKCG
ncbi:MAG: LAGLIDADG family homing endonuclease [Promethearchaeota archaeon]|jgi:ribonucleoside-diphosphate reductase alpha chain